MNLSGRLDSTNLTTLARVKQLVSPSVSDNSMDALFDRCITDTSRLFVDYLGLHATEKERTEVYEVRQHRNVIPLDARPIDLEATLTVKYQSTNDDWAGEAAIDADYLVWHAAAGTLTLRGVTTRSNPGYLQVTYTGGLGTDTLDIVSNFPDIANACDLQVKYMAERIHSLAGSVSTGAGGDSTYQSEYGLLKMVRATLDRHRRWGAS